MSSKTVSNPTGDRQEKIANAAKVLGKSELKKKVFKSIYTTKKKIKTIDEIMQITGITDEVSVLKQLKILVDENMIHKSTKKINGRSAFEKDGFYQTNRDKILSLTNDKKKLNAFSTRFNPRITIQKETIKIIKSFVKTKRIYLDEIDNFCKVKSVTSGSIRTNCILESVIKDGIINILREEYEQNDWGGETDDLFTTRLKIKGKRISTAFALKGRGKQGKLTPGKMGKNGDQIQRLFKSSSDLYILQYHSAIDESIFDLMESLAKAKSSTEGKEILYCVIDGNDTSRLIEAYKDFFNIK